MHYSVGRVVVVRRKRGAFNFKLEVSSFPGKLPSRELIGKHESARRILTSLSSYCVSRQFLASKVRNGSIGQTVKRAVTRHRLPRRQSRDSPESCR